MEDIGLDLVAVACYGEALGVALDIEGLDVQLAPGHHITRIIHSVRLRALQTIAPQANAFSLV